MKVDAKVDVAKRAPTLADHVKKIPEEIKAGTIVEFEKPIKLIGYPVLKGSAKRQNAVFGAEMVITVERGIIVCTNKNIVMLSARANQTETLFPLRHTLHF
jgi:hypothetical protein